MAGSRPWPTPPAKAAWSSRKGVHGTYPGAAATAAPRARQRGGGDRPRRGRGARRRPPAARPRGQRVRREARRHQPRRQGGEGRPALRLRRARRRRRRQGPRRLRLGQGARSAGGDPQGDRAGAARAWSACRCAKAARCITTSSAITAPARSWCARRRPGTGIIAGGPMRAIFEALGVQDVVAKSVGTSNPHNMIKATFEALEPLGQPARGRGAARQEGQRHPRPARRRWHGRGAGVGSWPTRRREPAKTARLKVTQIGSPIGRQARSARDPDRAGPQQDAPHARARGHARGARHDRQGAASGAGRSRLIAAARRHDDNRTMKLNEISDNPGAHNRASASAAASARARARPAAAAARARPRAPAWPSTASRAARCRCIAACRSAASTTSIPQGLSSWSISAACRRRSTPGRLDGRRDDRRRGAGRGRRAAPRRRRRAAAGQGRAQGASSPSRSPAPRKAAVAAVEKAGGQGDRGGGAEAGKPR